METLDIAAPDVIIARSSPVVDLSVVDLSAVAIAPRDEPVIVRWPGWARLTILLGGSAAVWAGVGFIALKVFRLG